MNRHQMHRNKAHRGALRFYKKAFRQATMPKQAIPPPMAPMRLLLKCTCPPTTFRCSRSEFTIIACASWLSSSSSVLAIPQIAPWLEKNPIYLVRLPGYVTLAYRNGKPKKNHSILRLMRCNLGGTIEWHFKAYSDFLESMGSACS